MLGSGDTPVCNIVFSIYRLRNTAATSIRAEEDATVAAAAATTAKRARKVRAS